MLRNPFQPVGYTGDQCVAVLHVAHKYFMEIIQAEIISQLKKAAKTTKDFINLMIASQVIDSEELYQEALRGLIRSEPKPTLEQAKRIGFDATYAVFSAITQDSNRPRNKNSKSNTSHSGRQSYGTSCPHCGSNFWCESCGEL
jgi:hypothetical protein